VPVLYIGRTVPEG